MTDDYYRFDERAHLLKGENTNRTYRLGDRVEVQVARVDLERRQIDLALRDVLARASTRRAAPGAAAKALELRGVRASRRPSPTRAPRRRGGGKARRNRR